MAASIEFLNELVDRFARATELNRKTKKRRGSTVHLSPEEADAVVVIGDLHGNRNNFNKVIRAVGLDKYPRRHLVLQEVAHGGPVYPNGGCMSHALLEDVAALKVKYPDRFHFLLCNHELSEFTSEPILKAGISQNMLFALGMEHAYGPAGDRIHSCYRDFVLSCPLAIRLSNGAFISHSIPSRKFLPKFEFDVLDREIERSDIQIGGAAHSLVWGRDREPDHVEAFCKAAEAEFVINGHWPAPAGFDRTEGVQIVLDASGPECYCCIVPTRSTSVDEIVAKMRSLK